MESGTSRHGDYSQLLTGRQLVMSVYHWWGFSGFAFPLVPLSVKPPVQCLSLISTAAQSLGPLRLKPAPLLLVLLRMCGCVYICVSCETHVCLTCPQLCVCSLVGVVGSEAALICWKKTFELETPAKQQTLGTLSNLHFQRQWKSPELLSEDVISYINKAINNINKYISCKHYNSPLTSHKLFFCTYWKCFFCLLLLTRVGQVIIFFWSSVIS